eukprot:883333-Rhodomonas_salina.3
MSDSHLGVARLAGRWSGACCSTARMCRTGRTSARMAQVRGFLPHLLVIHPRGPAVACAPGHKTAQVASPACRALPGSARQDQLGGDQEEEGISLRRRYAMSGTDIANTYGVAMQFPVPISQMPLSRYAMRCCGIST